jgi:Uma2 family endonuclease
MLRDDAILEPILDDRRLPEFIEVLTERWKGEQQLREEFYEKIQPGDKWEFINGKTIMHSPAKLKHTEARKKLSFILEAYISMTETGVVHDETSLVSLTRNDYLPDILFFTKEKAASFKPDTWKYPAPDFVVEILSDSTEANDRGIKMDDYAAHGVREYWLVDTDKQLVEQYLLDEPGGKFWLFTKKTTHDNIECQQVQGLAFPVAAIFDEKAKLQVVKGWLA